MDITKERKELYEKQKEHFYGDTLLAGSAFVPPSFICTGCGIDLLSDPATYKEAKKGKLITRCPYCGKSYCE